MNNREAFEAWVIQYKTNVILKRFANGDYISATTENYFNVWQAAIASQAQQTKIKPALKVVNGEICYQSTDDDQAYGMWCPVVYDTVHDFAEGTKFFAIPPHQMDATSES